jgi:prophage regulatory protein
MTEQASQSSEDKSDLNPIEQSGHTRLGQNPQAILNLKRAKLIRLPEVIQRVGIKKTKLYELQKAGCFPMSVQITSHAVGWVEEEIDAWIAERIAASRFQQNQ